MPAVGPGAIIADDWRALRLLSLYRLGLVSILLSLMAAGYIPQVLTSVNSAWYQWTCAVYGGAALLLAWTVLRRRTRMSVQAHVQAHVQYLVDLAAITMLVYASGGVDNGLGALLLIPAVTCALVLSARMAVMQAALGTLVLFGEQVLRHHGQPVDASDYTSTGVLGLILFGTAVAASTVAQRARRSEALAKRMGSEFDDLSRLNEMILDAMSTGVVVLDQNLRIGNLNAAARELLRTTSRAEGRALELESPPLALRLRRWLSVRDDDEQPLSLGSGMPEVIVRVTRLRSAASGPIMVLLEDASRLREQAQQIKLAALGRLSASIAHEIRNPLSAISHAGQLLYEADEIGADNRRLLAMIHRHTDRIDKIVGDVMALSRREVADRTLIPLAPWIEETVALYAEGHRQAPRPIEVAEIARGLRVPFDPHHLQQLMFNLWDNAFFHGARDNAAITVRLSVGVERNGRAWLDVSDNGPGVPAGTVDNIFEPFFTTAHGGTGLGLYLARELCELNQARLSYQQRPVGACFRVSFAVGIAV